MLQKKQWNLTTCVVSFVVCRTEFGHYSDVVGNSSVWRLPCWVKLWPIVVKNSKEAWWQRSWNVNKNINFELLTQQACNESCQEFRQQSKDDFEKLYMLICKRIPHKLISIASFKAHMKYFLQKRFMNFYVISIIHTKILLLRGALKPAADCWCVKWGTNILQIYW